MSYLGLDIGNKRIGVAVGSLMADELCTLILKEPAKSFFDGKEGTDQAVNQIRILINTNNIEKVIIGNPINDNGTESITSRNIITFAKKLEQIIEIPVILVDESLTSFVAEEMLKEEGLTIKESKTRVDQVSAKLILQQYIEEEDSYR
jgi:putative Holliday junction resolvase